MPDAAALAACLTQTVWSSSLAMRYYQLLLHKIVSTAL
jgi:hypothetical protein